MGRARGLFLAGVVMMSGCGTSSDREAMARAFTDRTREILTGATRVEVFRLDGQAEPSIDPPKERARRGFAGFPVIRPGPDQGGEFAHRLADVLSDPRTYTRRYVKCFWPGVAFRVWKGEECVTMLICFHCDNFYCGPPTDIPVFENASFHGSPRRSDLLRLAKEAFPGDDF